MKLKKNELLELFSASVDNAMCLFNAGQYLTTKYEGSIFPSLGLAELALEELGKSYLCLAYYSKVPRLQDWNAFWKEWRNHDLKAQRAYCYEFFCLLRVELDSQKFKDNFPTLRKKFSKEKEFSFYVDIDKSNRKIHVPKKEILDDECINRLFSLMGLLNATAYIEDWMRSENSEEFKNAISDYAYTVMTTKVFQQDAHEILKKMRSDNNEYNKGLGAIWELFNPHKN
jgi:AbiV family abortive infection protein